jgi:site-specific DNA-methyltransferase (adenine-specific)
MGWEAVAVLHRAGKKHWNGGGHHAVWEVPVEQGEHPAQKPLRLLNQWVRLFSDEGETVLDPCMGSGTTGVACARLRRKFVGVERERRWFDLACRRVEAAYRQPNLFLSQTTVKHDQRRLF